MYLYQIITAALEEDIGSGDHTSLACIDKEKTGTARLLVKEKGIIAGVELAKNIFHFADKNLQVTIFINDGAEINPGDVVLEVTGSELSILKSERVVLNFMQRMSGIATKTKQLNQLIKHTKAKLLDTRKTTPLLREIEKLAVKTGGGENHRFGLYDMILLKDNHIDFCGGITKAIEKTQHYLKEKKLNLRIEVETRTLDDVREVLAIGGIHRIMLDNFTPEKLKEAVALINGKYETEASGGINESNIRAYAETGVDFISVGALTHHINSLDLSLKATSP
ncbi:MAG: putative nicotinate-nucleotide pyrophosphorylase [carboxylating] [Bacteroidia bacterium]|nr:putative nicotinate-nucleotide pyrophosphorylase [carboxylating] [Bacteroidia bacterium]